MSSIVSYSMVLEGKNRDINKKYNNVDLEHKLLKDMDDEDFISFAEKYNDFFVKNSSFKPMKIPENGFDNIRNSSNEKRRVTFAKTEGDIVGISLCEERIRDGKEYGYIQVVGVDERYRRAGIGKAIILESLNWFHKELGIDTIYIDVDADNIAALKLYNSLGFRIHQKGIIHIT